MGCNAPLGYDDHCDGECESCSYWDEKYDDEEDSAMNYERDLRILRDGRDAYKERLERIRQIIKMLDVFLEDFGDEICKDCPALRLKAEVET